jgi:glycosyltransferase involved in cell wall biosynthesis
VWIPGDGPIRAALTTAGAVCETAPELNTITRSVVFHPRSLARYGMEMAGSAASLARKIRASRPDIVHTNTSVLPAAGLAARLSGSRHLWHIREWFGEFPLAWGFYQWYLSFFADRRVCVSHAVARQFHPALRRRVRVVYDGFPSAEFDTVTPERTAAFRAAFGLDDRLVVGTVGRIKWKRKGQENFLRAAALLRDAYPEARFLCIGSPFPGNEEHLVALQRLAEEVHLDREWIVTGDIADNLGAIAALDVLVHPPGQPEPFAGAVIEAMALGKPVVGTALGGTAEQVENNVTGFLVPPDDPPALAGAIRALLEDKDLRREMGARGRKRYLDRFTWEPCYRSILEEYSAIMTLGVRP